jgi:hypothetical protein
MSRSSIRLALTAAVTLAAGAAASPALAAGASPALAASPTPLKQAIEKLDPLTKVVINEDLSTPTEDRKVIQTLVKNAYTREQAANQVAKIPAISSQQTAKADWLSAQHEGVRLDIEVANAVYIILSGHPTAGRQVLTSTALRNVQFRLNKLTAEAEGALGI